jgi:FAD/FMN-containing dehydrogenase
MATTIRDTDESAVEEFRESLRGTLLQPDDEGYEEARSIWNAMIDRRPTLIAQCAGTADVLAAVGFAREHDLLVAVKGGGHNVAGKAVCDDGLVIDLSPMSSVRVDPDAKTVRVGPGATWGDVDPETQAFGLGVPGGIVSMTGVAGLTLGGGIGWLSRAHGLTLDNLRSVDVVTAEGAFLTAAADRNPDLFWGIRGGGGNFGVVTSFEFDLHEVGPEVLAGVVFYPFEAAPAVLRFYRDFMTDAPDEVGILPVLSEAQPDPRIPEEVHGTKVLKLFLFYADDPDAGEAVFDPFYDVARPIADLVTRQPYVEFQQAFDETNLPGARNYWKAHYLAGLPDAAIETVVEFATSMTSSESLIGIHGLGGAIERVPPAATAYRHRDAPFNLSIVTRWQHRTEDERHIAWTQEFFEAMKPYSTDGVYVNFLDQEGDERVKAAYGDNYDRLVDVKNEYDPGNLFRMNQNIVPTA